MTKLFFKHLGIKLLKFLLFIAGIFVFVWGLNKFGIIAVGVTFVILIVAIGVILDSWAKAYEEYYRNK